MRKLKYFSWFILFIAVCLLLVSPEGNVKKLFEGEKTTPEVIALRAADQLLSYFPYAIQQSIDLNHLEAWLEGEDKKASTDAAGWAKYRRMQLSSDEKGTVKPSGWADAQVARKALVKKTRSTAEAPLLGAAGLSSSNWTWIGPGNQGGRIRSILVHPTVAGTLWVGSVGGGVWKSTNSGASWTVLQDSMTNLAITSLAMDASGASTLYAGTGEGFGNVDGIRGAGIFKSTDGGGSWSQLSSTDPASTSADFYFVNRISAHPSSSGTILAATQGGLYRTADGGSSWSKVLSVSQMTDVKYMPTNGNYALAGRGYYGGYVYYSTNGGATWTQSSLTTTGRTEVAWGTGGVAYAVSDVNNGTVYRSTNYGASWTLVKSTGHLSGQGWYANAIWVNPSNNAEIIVGGLDLWRSTDSGSSFTKISNWMYGGQYGSAAHADHHFIASMPTYNGSSNATIYFANDGGMYRSDAVSTLSQYGTNWINLNNNLGVTQFYGGAGHNGTNGHIVGGTQDNGDLVYSGSGTSWDVFSGGDGGKSAIDPTNGNYIYGEYVYLSLHRSTNGACCASDIVSGLTDAGSNALFIAPFAIDRSNPNNMWAGGTSLWYTTTLKATTPSWSRAYSAGNYISQVALGSSTNVWFGTVGGALLNNTNALSSPGSFVSKASGLPTGRAVLSIFVDRSNSNIVYVGFGGYNTGNIWKSTNGGTSWTNIHGALPATPIYSIQTNPSNANYIYIGTEVGVFTSEDGGASWSTTNDGPANVSTQELFWLDSTTLVAATHGRGMFTTSVSTSPTTYDISYTRAGTGSGSVSFSPTGTQSSCSASCTNTYSSGTSVTLTATASSGSTFAGWSGACSGTSTCSVTMSAAKSVTATFNTSTTTYDISYTRAGTGSGSVSFSPSGTQSSCSASCTNTYTSGTSVTLTATASSGSTFTGWSGTAGCSGTSTCTLTMSAAKAVTATFNTSSSYTLSYTKAGAGLGTVAFSSGTNSSCTTSCSNTYTAGTSVTLTATAGSVTAMPTSVPFVTAAPASSDRAAIIQRKTTLAPARSTVIGEIQLTTNALDYPQISIEIAGQIYSFTRQRLDQRGPGDLSWHGTLDNGEGTAVATVKDGEVIIIVEIGAEHYEIYSADMVYGIVTKTNSRAFPEEHPPGLPSGAISSSTNDETLDREAPATRSKDNVVVDVLVAYTTAAKNAYGGSMATLAQASVDASNQAYLNSGINITMRLAGTKEVTYTESTFETAVSDLVNGTNGMSVVQSERNAVGADLVGLLVNMTSYCGLASSISATSGNAYMAVYYDCAVSNQSFAHEFGHLFGARHDPYVDATSTPYAYGHGYIAPNSAWRTVMAYGNGCNNCQRLRYFSSPLITYSGVAMGTTGTNDNARVHRERAATVAAFKTATTTTYSVSLSASPSLGGTVSGSGTFNANSTVSVSATPATNYTFSNWTENGSVVSTSSTYSFTLTANRSLQANFTSTSSSFTGWSGACSGTSSTCTLTMDAGKSVTATFGSSTTYDLSYTKAGTGLGSVSFSPSGTQSSCSASCTNTYSADTSVTLTATADSGSTFTGWSGTGGCTGTSTCTLTMSAAKAVTATFTTTTTYSLTYTKAGTGSGSVSFSPSGTQSSCSASCTNSYSSGTSVTLTATAGSGAVFAGWSGTGGCTGTSTCTLTMSAAKSVTATFNTAVTYALAYTKAGTGSGTVEFSSGTNTSCTSSCTNTYTSGTSVTLTATASSGSTFTGWSGKGGCTGTSSTCTVSMTAAKAVIATFTLIPPSSYFATENMLYCGDANGNFVSGFYFGVTIDKIALKAYSTYYTAYSRVTPGSKKVALAVTNVSCASAASGSTTFTMTNGYYYLFSLDGYSNGSWQYTVYSSTSPETIRENKMTITVPAKTSSGQKFDKALGTPTKVKDISALMPMRSSKGFSD